MSSSKEITLTVENREKDRKSAIKQLRKNGRIPCVVYARGTESKSYSVSTIEFAHAMGHSGVISLKSNDLNLQVIIRDIQSNAITNQVIHIDFQEVRKGEKISSVIPIKHTGTPAGLAHGGQLEQRLHELHISCIPSKMIEFIEIDVTHMDIDDIMHISDLPAIDGIEFTADVGIAVFQVHVPKAELADDEESDEEADAEPEVIAKGKTEE